MAWNEIAVWVGVLSIVAYSYVLRRKNLWLSQKNLVLNKKLKKSRRKEDNWRMGWDLEKQRFLDALSDAFLLVNAQGQVLAANDAAKILFNNQGLEGNLLLECSRNEELNCVIRRSFEEVDKNYRDEFFLSPPGELTEGDMRGSSRWFIDVSPILGFDGHRRILLRNITKQYRIDQVRKDFVANASHELRTPLTIIIGYLENMIEDYEEGVSLVNFAPFLPTMHKHGIRLQRIVEDMLMISKLESGDYTQIKEKEFLLVDCLLEVQVQLAKLFEEKSATLTLELCSEKAVIMGDKFYWTQIFFNLIENALKQNSKLGLHVIVGAKADEEGRGIIFVSDNGVGIKEKDLPFIFNRFYRAGLSGKGAVKGTGLGLSIARHSVEAHGGTISVISVPGDKTQFTITLPPGRLSCKEENE